MSGINQGPNNPMYIRPEAAQDDSTYTKPEATQYSQPQKKGAIFKPGESKLRRCTDVLYCATLCGCCINIWANLFNTFSL